MAHDDLIYEIEAMIERAVLRYGDFASSHEALGVASEEWDELKDAIRSNDMASIKRECLDLASVLIRLARSVTNNQTTISRSGKGALSTKALPTSSLFLMAIAWRS